MCFVLINCHDSTMYATLASVADSTFDRYNGKLVTHCAGAGWLGNRETERRFVRVGVNVWSYALCGTNQELLPFIRQI